MCDQPAAFTNIEYVSLGISKHEVAFLDAGWQRFRKSFSDCVSWSLPLYFRFSHFRLAELKPIPADKSRGKRCAITAVFLVTAFD
jgi:hypothetical protein